MSAQKKHVSKTHSPLLPKMLTALARRIAGDIASGSPSSGGLEAMLDLAAEPYAVLDLTDLLTKEGNKKRPEAKLMEGYLFLFSSLLAELGFRNDKDPKKARLLHDIQAKLLDTAQSGEISTELLMMLLNQFHDARLDVGPELREAMETSMRARPLDPADEFDLSAPDANPFAEMLEQFEGDVFALSDFLAQGADVMPQDTAVKMLPVALFADAEPLREAVLGFLLSDKPYLRDGLLDLLDSAASQGKITSVMLRRMIAMRNWLPKKTRPKLDRAIRTCRKNKTKCASWPKLKNIGEIWATGVDGAGAQSMILVAKEGRRHAVVGILPKQGKGIRDAWVSHQMTLNEVRQLLNEIQSQMVLSHSDMDYVNASVRHFLGMNVQSGEMPPYRLLEVAETIGIGDLNPAFKPTRELVDELCGYIGKEISDDMISTAFDFSEDWEMDHPVTQSWFLEGPELQKLTKGSKSKEKTIQLLLDGPMEKRREWWAELIAWMALSLRHEILANGWSEEDNGDWTEFAIVAAEILKGHPLSDIPFMRQIAETSLELAD